jgi:hypothetical protein
MTTDSTTGAYLTARQACDRLGYSRPDSLLRAWRARGLPLYRRPGGHYLLDLKDVGRFVQPAAARGHTGQHGQARCGLKPASDGGTMRGRRLLIQL